MGSVSDGMTKFSQDIKNSVDGVEAKVASNTAKTVTRLDDQKLAHYSQVGQVASEFAKASDLIKTQADLQRSQIKTQSQLSSMAADSYAENFWDALSASNETTESILASAVANATALEASILSKDDIVPIATSQSQLLEEALTSMGIDFGSDVTKQARGLKSVLSESFDAQSVIADTEDEIRNDLKNQGKYMDVLSRMKAQYTVLKKKIESASNVLEASKGIQYHRPNRCRGIAEFVIISLGACEW
jgi:hypothetical protein